MVIEGTKTALADESIEERDERSMRDPAFRFAGTNVAIFAGMIMLLAGIFQGLEGLAAILSGNFFAANAALSSNIYTFDIPTWGWVHLLMGIFVALVGLGIMSGQLWARAVGILFALSSATVHFIFMPYYPLWSLLIIAFDIVVIAALASYTPQKFSQRKEIRRLRDEARRSLG